MAIPTWGWRAAERRRRARGRAEPGTIAICFVAAALQSVRDRGLNADEMLANVGLSSSLLQVPQARVSAKHYGALWRNIALALDDEFFGQDSRRMKSGSFAMLCHAAVACKTLGQALDRSLRFYSLILDDISGTLVRDAAEARIVLHERVAGAGQRVFAHELLLLLLYGVSCWLVGRRIPILRTEFSYAEPAHSAEYRLMYCADLRFGRPNTAIIVRGRSPGSAGGAERALDQGVFAHGAGEHLAEIQERQQPQRASQAPAAPDPARRGAGFRGSGRGIQFDPRDDAPPFARGGSLLSVDQGSTAPRSRHQLLEPYDRSVMEIAVELGFSERSAFHRAFRKWTGASPGEFRRTLQA